MLSARNDREMKVSVDPTRIGMDTRRAINIAKDKDRLRVLVILVVGWFAFLFNNVGLRGLISSGRVLFTSREVGVEGVVVATSAPFAVCQVSPCDPRPPFHTLRISSLDGSRNESSKHKCRRSVRDTTVETHDHVDQSVE